MDSLTKIREQEKELLVEDVNKTPPSDVIAFTEQRSCADLLRLVTSEQLNINPDFQRGEVWKSPEKSRFVDSLTKQLPIPSMCFSVDASNHQRLVIDGLQRTSTVVAFLDYSKEMRLSNLDDIDERLRGKTNIQVRNEHPDLWSIIENAMITVTVIRCDYKNADHMEYLYMIFQRLNTNAVKLNNQEIRNCIYNGTLNTILKRIAKEATTIKLYGESKRLGTEEYLLRVMAFNERLEKYDGRMAKFLNDYMFDNRFIDHTTFESRLQQTVALILGKIAPERPVKQLSRTLLEGVVVGVLSNLKSLRDIETAELIERFDRLVQSSEFSAENLSEGLSSKKKVHSRLSVAKQIFKVSK